MSDDPRLGDLIKRVESGDAASVAGLSAAFLGFPYDEGVRRNGGRVGARGGPEAVRRLMQRIGTLKNPETGHDLRGLVVADLGDIDAGLELERGHKKLTAAVESIVQTGACAFVVGGGNDQSYPNACGMMNATEGSVGVVNIDAHLDVRPLKNGRVHSGSPFRLLLEDEVFAVRDGQFLEFAAQGMQCSDEHAQYLYGKNCEIVWYSQLQKCQSVAQKFVEKINTLGDNVFVSFDIDSIRAADCPGVSCPAAIGITAEDALAICYESGKHPNVRMMDISEYNPLIEEYRTGRLVGMMFYWFLVGLSERVAAKTKKASK